MREYSDFPPYSLLITSIKQCPEACHLYVDLWKNKPKSTSLISMIEKCDIRSMFLMSPTMFRNKCMALMENELVSMKEFPTYFEVDLVTGE